MNQMNNTPFTAEEFHLFLEKYNRIFWPGQIISYLIGVGILVLLLTGASRKNRIISWLTGGLWLWNGIVFFLVKFTAIEPAAAVFGWGFILQGIHLIAHGGILGDMDFRWNNLKKDCFPLIIILCSLLVYPLIGLLAGQRWPSLPLFGTIPCPLTLFSLGILISNKQRMPRGMTVIPVIWSLMALNAAINFDVPQDLLLAPSAVAAVILVTINNRKALVRVEETSEGIQGNVTVEEYDRMQRGFRDRGIIKDKEIVRSGIQTGTAVELGPGPGYLGLEWLKRTSGTRVVGVEISPEMIKTAEKNSKEYGLSDRTRYRQGTVMAIPLENNNAEAVFSNGSMHEWEQPDQVLNEAFRILKSGGKLFISDLKRNLSPGVTGLMKILTPGDKMKAGLLSSIQAAYRKKELKHMMENSLFRDYRITESLFGLTVTARKP